MQKNDRLKHSLNFRGRTLHPMWESVGILQDWRQDTIRQEPMLFSCDVDHAYEYGGPITANFLNSLRDLGVAMDRLVIDSRTHMLMPGWYPAIPGWHIDGLRRPDGGQPAWDNRPVADIHYVSVVGNTAMTEFVAEPVKMPTPKTRVYEEWDRYLNDEPVHTEFIRPNEILAFGSSDLHRATPATQRSWRFFIRASDAEFTPTNETRTQVQVYLDSINAGW